jgi:hypothetical protein
MDKEKKDINMKWFRQNLISLLLTAIFTITMGLSGYIYNQDKKITDDKFTANDVKFNNMLILINKDMDERKEADESERTERKKADDKLRERIDNRVSYREFVILTGNVKETNQDVKEILKKLEL